MSSPWALLARMPDVALEWTTDDNVLLGRRARWYPGSRRIVIDSRLRRLKIRCSLAHEIGHVVLEHPTPCGNDFYDQRVEAEADEFAARLLLPDLELLAREIATTTGGGHAAHHLNVTLDMFDVRMATLDATERAFIDRLVFMHQEGQGA